MKTQEIFAAYTDTEIISEIRSGNTALYELLVRRHNPVLYKTGRSYGFNHQDTEDLMQDSYVSAFFSLEKFEGRALFSTWLIRIMLNKCYHKKLKNSFENTVIASQVNNKTEVKMNHDKDPQKTLVNRELAQVVEKALLDIPEDYRLIFSLRELAGLSIKETAETAEISETNVKVRLNRAKSMLRDKITKMYSPAEIYEFNLVYCDGMVQRVMAEIQKKL